MIQEIRFEVVGGTLVSACIASDTDLLPLDIELGTLEDRSPGHYLICELELFRSEAGQIADEDVDSLHPLHIVILQLAENRIDHTGDNGNLVHVPE